MDDFVHLGFRRRRRNLFRWNVSTLVDFGKANSNKEESTLNYLIVKKIKYINKYFGTVKKYFGFFINHVFPTTWHHNFIINKYIVIHVYSTKNHLVNSKIRQQSNIISQKNKRNHPLCVKIWTTTNHDSTYKC